MSAFDICVIVLLSAAFIGITAKLIYNKIKGKSSCGDCSGCSGGCSNCSACSHCSAQKTPESKDNK